MDGRLESHPNGLVITRTTLSRRNLRTLLAALDAPGHSERSIWRGLGGGLTVVLTAEEDADHYVPRARTAKQTLANGWPGRELA